MQAINKYSKSQFNIKLKQVLETEVILICFNYSWFLVLILYLINIA
jgi:hypothetical protein